MTVTGVRWAESVNRKKNQGIVTVHAKKNTGLEEYGFTPGERHGFILTNDNDESRRMVEQCYRRHKTTVNPIIDWTDADVWEFIIAERIPYCGLYDEGFHRLGCIGCPMASRREREREFLRWGKYKEQYLRSFEKMLQYRKERHAVDPSKPIWRSGGKDNDNQTAQDVFNWWMEYDTLPGQIDLLEEDDG